jgi:hypothetical protein
VNKYEIHWNFKGIRKTVTSFQDTFYIFGWVLSSYLFSCSFLFGIIYLSTFNGRKVLFFCK